MHETRMKLKIVAALLFAALPLQGCEREGPGERAGEEVDEAVDEAGDAIDEAGDDLRDDDDR